MGPVQCKSTKTKKIDLDNQFKIINKSKQLNYFEKRIKEEYKRLKDIIEGKRKGTSVEISFGLNEYKKQLSRLVKWSNIAYEKLPQSYYEEKKKDVYNKQILLKSSNYTNNNIIKSQDTSVSADGLSYLNCINNALEKYCSPKLLVFSDKKIKYNNYINSSLFDKSNSNKVKSNLHRSKYFSIRNREDIIYNKNKHLISKSYEEKIHERELILDDFSNDEEKKINKILTNYKVFNYTIDKPNNAISKNNIFKIIKEDYLIIEEIKKKNKLKNYASFVSKTVPNDSTKSTSFLFEKLLGTSYPFNINTAINYNSKYNNYINDINNKLIKNNNLVNNCSFNKCFYNKLNKIQDDYKEYVHIFKKDTNRTYSFSKKLNYVLKSDNNLCKYKLYNLSCNVTNKHYNFSKNQPAISLLNFDKTNKFHIKSSLNDKNKETSNNYSYIINKKNTKANTNLVESSYNINDTYINQNNIINKHNNYNISKNTKSDQDYLHKLSKNVQTNNNAFDLLNAKSNLSKKTSSFCNKYNSNKINTPVQYNKVQTLKNKFLIDTKIFNYIDNNNSLKKDDETLHNKIYTDEKNKINLSNNENSSISFNIECYNSLTKDQVEFNLRSFFQNNKEKLLERVAKGPPYSYRWISWMIISCVPLERSEELYNYYCSLYVLPETELQIKKDLNRTLPETLGNQLSQKDIIEKEFTLYKLLHAFAANDPEVAYCQGMNYIAFFILLISDFREVESFYMLFNIFSDTFNSKLGIRGFYTQGFYLLNYYVYVFHYFFEQRNSKLRKHISETLELNDDIWVSKWFMSLFTICFPFEVVARIWDCLFVYGLEFLVKFTLSFLSSIESKLLKIDDTFDLLDYFKSLSPYENSSLLNDISCSNSFYSYYVNNNIINNDLNINITSSNANSSILKIKIEEIISNAIKMHLGKSTLDKLKKQFEEKHNINLNELNKKYNINNEKYLEGLTAIDCKNTKDDYFNIYNNINISDNYDYNKEILKEKTINDKKINLNKSPSDLFKKNNTNNYKAKLDSLINKNVNINTNTSKESSITKPKYKNTIKDFNNKYPKKKTSSVKIIDLLKNVKEENNKYYLFEKERVFDNSNKDFSNEIKANSSVKYKTNNNIYSEREKVFSSKSNSNNYKPNESSNNLEIEDEIDSELKEDINTKIGMYSFRIHNKKKN